jgi:hypothetical protein
VIGLFSNPHPFFRNDEPLSKLSHLSEASGQPATREHGGIAQQATTIPEPLAFEGGHVSSERLNRLTIVTEGVIDLAQVEIRGDLEGEILESRGNAEGALTGPDGAVWLAYGPEKYVM